MKLTKRLYTLSLTVTLFVTGFLLPGFSTSCTAQTETNSSPAYSCIEVPKSISFCDTEIDLTRYDRRERMDRELMAFTYMHSTSLQIIKRANRYFPIVEPILKKNGIDPKNDLSIDQSIDFGSTAAAFSGGQGDFTVEFEPHATLLEQKGDGYVVASLGKDSGYVPYTAFSTRKSFLDENPDVIRSFTAALQKGMDYVQSHSPEEIAAVIQPQFEENDAETLAAIITRYDEQDTWKEDLVFEEASFTLLQNILEEAGELEKRVPYEDLVNTSFAEEVK